MTSAAEFSMSQFEHRLSHPPKNPKDPLTVFAKHRVQIGKERQFEEWYENITEYQHRNLLGYLGSELIKPTCCEDNEYVSIIRYDTYDHLEAFMNSPERLELLSRTVEFEEEPLKVSYHSLEYWFVAPGEEDTFSPRPPPRYKMVIVTFFVIWLQAHFISRNLSKVPNMPPVASEALGTFCIVALTTYFLMPITTKYLLHWWLFPKSSSPSKEALNAEKRKKRLKNGCKGGVISEEGKEDRSMTEKDESNSISVHARHQSDSADTEESA